MPKGNGKYVRYINAARVLLSCHQLLSLSLSLTDLCTHYAWHATCRHAMRAAFNVGLYARKLRSIKRTLITHKGEDKAGEAKTKTLLRRAHGVWSIKASSIRRVRPSKMIAVGIYGRRPQCGSERFHKSCDKTVQTCLEFLLFECNKMVKGTSSQLIINMRNEQFNIRLPSFIEFPFFHWPHRFIKLWLLPTSN